MRYAKIREMDVSNGIGIGVSLFVQGCPHRCPHCFNQETWDFNEGKIWTKYVEDKFFELVSQPYIKRVSFLGGEPLADPNVETILQLINKIKIDYPEKEIWLWTGYKYDDIITDADCSSVEDYHEKSKLRLDIINCCDYIIDGRYIDSLRDLRLKFKGSSNQRVIDIKKTIQNNEIVLAYTN